MAAVLRNLGFPGDVVRPLSIASRTRNRHDFDGQRESDGNRCLAYLPTLAFSPPTRFEVLFSSSLVRFRIFNSLDHFGRWAGGTTPWCQPSAGFLEIPRSWLATSDGPLAIRPLRGRFLCGADAESLARTRNACRTCRGAGCSCASGCDSRPFESAFSVQRSTHSCRFGEVPANHGGKCY